MLTPDSSHSLRFSEINRSLNKTKEIGYSSSVIDKANFNSSNSISKSKNFVSNEITDEDFTTTISYYKAVLEKKEKSKTPFQGQKDNLYTPHENSNHLNISTKAGISNNLNHKVGIFRNVFFYITLSVCIIFTTFYLL